MKKTSQSNIEPFASPWPFICLEPGEQSYSENFICPDVPWHVLLTINNLRIAKHLKSHMVKYMSDETICEEFDVTVHILDDWRSGIGVEYPFPDPVYPAKPPRSALWLRRDVEKWYGRIRGFDSFSVVWPVFRHIGRVENRLRKLERKRRRSLLIDASTKRRQRKEARHDG